MGLRARGDAWTAVVTSAGVFTLAGLLAPACRRPQPPLVLLVSVDTLRADHLGAYGDRRGLTPRLDRLAAQSLVFEHAYAPASFTLPSLAALMTSRYPEEVGVTGNSTVLAPQAAKLAADFRARGFRTGAVVSNYVLRRDSGFDAGFDAYDATFPQREAVRAVPERTAPDTTAAALRLLDELTRERAPAFLWVHYQDPHGPYAPPDPRRERHLAAEQARPDARRELPVAKGISGSGAIPKYQFLEPHRDPAFYRAGYAAEVAYVDEAIGALLDGLEQRGRQEASLVFLADHGESLGEDDYWFAHGERLSDPLVRVPLLVKAAGVAAGRRRDLASLLDVFPTLSALTGGTPPAGLRGRNLLAPDAASGASPVYLSTLAVAPVPRCGIVSHDRKYLVGMEPAGTREQLFALGAEDRDLAVSEPKALDALRRELAAARAGLRRADASSQDLSHEERENLLTLGYVEGGATPIPSCGAGEPPQAAAARD